MMTITKPKPDQVDLELRGMLDAEMMRKGLDTLLDASEDVTNGRMLYKIPEFAMPTLAAIGVEFSRLPRLFGLLAKFKKFAVLTDSAWLRSAAEIEGAVLPGMTIKAFKLDEVEAAQAWLDTPLT